MADILCLLITQISQESANLIPCRVLTYKDIPGQNVVVQMGEEPEPLLAEKEVRFHGQPVAIVLAGKLHVVQVAYILQLEHLYSDCFIVRVS